MRVPAYRSKSTYHRVTLSLDALTLGVFVAILADGGGSTLVGFVLGIVFVRTAQDIGYWLRDRRDR